MKQLTILTDNRPGVLADIAERLGSNGINMKSITAETFTDSGIIRILTKDSEGAKNSLAKTPYKVMLSDVLLFAVEDGPGALGKLARRLQKANVNIEHIYHVNTKGGKSILAAKVDRVNEARKELREALVEDF